MTWDPKTLFYFWLIELFFPRLFRLPCHKLFIVSNLRVQDVTDAFLIAHERVKTWKTNLKKKPTHKSTKKDV